jgi:hypothetical protein
MMKWGIVAVLVGATGCGGGDEPAGDAGMETQDGGSAPLDASPAVDSGAADGGPVDGGTAFRIASLGTTGCTTVDHELVTGDDRGGIAVGRERVLYSGDDATGI